MKLRISIYVVVLCCGCNNGISPWKSPLQSEKSAIAELRELEADLSTRLAELEAALESVQMKTAEIQVPSPVEQSYLNAFDELQARQEAIAQCKEDLTSTKARLAWLEANIDTTIPSEAHRSADAQRIAIIVAEENAIKRELESTKGLEPHITEQMVRVNRAIDNANKVFDHIKAERVRDARAELNTLKSRLPSIEATLAGNREQEKLLYLQCANLKPDYDVLSKARLEKLEAQNKREALYSKQIAEVQKDIAACEDQRMSLIQELAEAEAARADAERKIAERESAEDVELIDRNTSTSINNTSSNPGTAAYSPSYSYSPPISSSRSVPSNSSPTTNHAGTSGSGSRYYDPTYRPPVEVEYVRPTITKDGHYRQGHMRTKKDDSFWNNMSSKGNQNPYTGKAGTKQPPVGYR